MALEHYAGATVANAQGSHIERVLCQVSSEPGIGGYEGSHISTHERKARPGAR